MNFRFLCLFGFRQPAERFKSLLISALSVYVRRRFCFGSKVAYSLRRSRPNAACVRFRPFSPSIAPDLGWCSPPQLAWYLVPTTTLRPHRTEFEVKSPPEQYFSPSIHLQTNVITKIQKSKWYVYLAIYKLRSAVRLATCRKTSLEGASRLFGCKLGCKTIPFRLFSIQTFVQTFISDFCCRNSISEFILDFWWSCIQHSHR